VTLSYPNATQRQFMQRLRTDEWLSFPKLKMVVGDKLLDRLVSKGWIERRREGRTLQLKLTAEGLTALHAKI
jgi:predicted transcriptional regulator